MNSPLLPAQKAETLLFPEAAKPTDPRGHHAFAYARDFLENRFVYLTISPRARGLSMGVNLNPDRKCNFDCVYCEVDRTQPVTDPVIDCEVAAAELQRALQLVHTGNLGRLPPYNALPAELLRLRHVALSGDGEPTISPKFLETVETVVHVRALGLFPFFKIVLITNASGLDRSEVQRGLSYFTPRDEIWAKLDTGCQRDFEHINRPKDISYEKIVRNILHTARRRPVNIQSLFCQVAGMVPTATEVEQYALRLRDLKEAGAQIPLVQIYSATRPTPHSDVRHLPLRTLRDIAETVRRVAGLPAEPF